ADEQNRAADDRPHGDLVRLLLLPLPLLWFLGSFARRFVTLLLVLLRLLVRIVARGFLLLGLIVCGVGAAGVDDVLVRGKHVTAFGAFDLGIRLRSDGQAELGSAFGATEFNGHDERNSPVGNDSVPTCRSYRVKVGVGKGQPARSLDLFPQTRQA